MTSLGELLAFIDRLELAEARLLVWGVVDGAFSEEELRTAARVYLGEAAGDAEIDVLLTELEQRSFLFSFLADGRRRYRTRSGEALRLLSRLRQLFERHAGPRWRLASTLVADFRYVLQPRTFPERSVVGATCWDRLQARLELAPVSAAVLRRVLSGGSGGPDKWSEFQVEAIEHLVANGYGRLGACVITAGTGSGKTYAFYLPALVHLVREITEDPSPRTQVLALYPRNELLKDQLREALRQTGPISDLIPRPIRIGAFYGAVPYSPEEISAGRAKAWERVVDGWVCPYLSCPDCGDRLVWRTSDMDKGQENLVCQRGSCKHELSGDRLALTRQSMATRPPDLMFTTTEMLNRRMTDPQFAHLFGVGPRGRIKLVLLDEVHIYEGVHGAQVALLIRRWRRLSRARAYFVGLSATIENATDFMGVLTGVPGGLVREITPRPETLERQGAEYLVALRGDPVSGTSLLSTSIQTSMLMRRVLDPWDRPLSDRVFGRRLFVFTDDLDVTNRLYHTLRDAEGLRVPPRAIGSLANLRASALSDHGSRLVWGQSWDLAERIGHRLAPDSRLNIGRTTSQDAGVDPRADIIVATASLDVGFNDPELGAIVQHKAPREAAQFIQRRGRAGRNPTMRPWTVVVLSDYGRDRIAYQAYDQLFAPRLAPRSLPIRNRYVLRMQATFAFLDWIFLELGQKGGSLWDSLRRPASNEWERDLQARVITLLRGLISSPERVAHLRRYICEALQADPTDVDAVLWESPRPVVRGGAVLLLRRLSGQWKGLDGREEPSSDRPLPEFIPASLFFDLNLPEASLAMPPEGDQAMPVAQAMNEFAPGRVSRRFAIKNLRHWLPVDLSGTNPVHLEIDGLGRMDESGDVADPQVQDKFIDLYRPRILNLSAPPVEVLDTSNAFLEWGSEFRAQGDGNSIGVFPRAWRRLDLSLTFFLHALGSPAEVRRFAKRGSAEIATRRGRRSVAYEFVQGGVPVALGFAGTFDGLRVLYQVPSGASVLPVDAGELAGFRTMYFLHLVTLGEAWPTESNPFERQWLGQVYLSALLARSVEARSDLKTAHEYLRQSDAQEIGGVLDTIFQTLPIESESEAGDGVDTDAVPRLQQRLNALIAMPEIIDRLGELAKVLWQPLDDHAADWARERLSTSLALAFREAIGDLCPEADADDIQIDLVPGGARQREFWITETAVGGVGFLETFYRRFVADQARFFRLVVANLGPSDHEIVDAEVSRVLELALHDDEVRDQIARVRTSGDHSSFHRMFTQLLEMLRGRGIFICHPVVAALTNRLLRPGSSVASDSALGHIRERWMQEEVRIGVEIEPRVIAYVLARDPSIRDRLPGVDSVRDDRNQWAFGAIYSMLWPRGAHLRAIGLASYNRFQSHVPSDRSAALRVLDLQVAELRLTEDWRWQVEAALERDGEVALVGETTDARRLRSSLLDLAAIPPTAGYLFVNPRVTGVERERGRLVVHLDIREGPIS